MPEAFCFFKSALLGVCVAAYGHLRAFLSSRLCSWTASSGKAPIRNSWTITSQQPLTVSTHNKAYFGPAEILEVILVPCYVCIETDWCPKFFRFLYYLALFPFVILPTTFFLDTRARAHTHTHARTHARTHTHTHTHMLVFMVYGDFP